MLADPFLIPGPAVISFSGGRTSAYMLWRILQAHGGTLPDDVVVCFANTGREMPATLDFVRDCGAVWNVHIAWLEYRRDNGRNVAVEVSHNSASRQGEPFEALILARSFLPNPVARYCTSELKIRTIFRWTSKNWSAVPIWTQVIGLRADEPKRVERILDPEKQKKSGREARNVACPLATAGITQSDVFAFWKAQPFDLHLKGPWEGNCDGCFLKARAGLERMFLDHPDRMKWWEQQESQIQHGAGTGATFRANREDYATMAQTIRDQGRLPFDVNEATIPCDDAGCGV